MCILTADSFRADWVLPRMRVSCHVNRRTLWAETLSEGQRRSQTIEALSSSSQFVSIANATREPRDPDRPVGSTPKSRHTNTRRRRRAGAQRQRRRLWSPPALKRRDRGPAHKPRRRCAAVTTRCCGPGDNPLISGSGKRGLPYAPLAASVSGWATQTDFPDSELQAPNAALCLTGL